ncbi:MAG: Vacuolar protein sorting-associated protein 17 [Geoglossum simile]|nr:MAG: Vacuolar protein sorting-associated protein 17 [Geoglossum simile]
MDYSSLPNDQDGASPWSTSPQLGRTTFTNPTVDSPMPPPQFGSAISPIHAPDYSSDHEGLSGSGGFTRPESSGTDDLSSTTEDAGEPGIPDLSERLQGPRTGEQGLAQHQHSADQRPEAQRHRPTGPAGKPGQRANLPQYKLEAKITGLERTGRKDPILRFDVHTNLPKYRTTQYRDVRRTHSEFVKLSEHLISSNPEAFVPSVPPPVTSAGAGTDEDEARVKASMQRWLNYVCKNEVLMRDEEMVLFVESDFGYSPMVRRKQPATGVRRKVIKQFAPPPDDTPDLANARPVVKLFYLGTMETGHKVDRIVKARRSLGLAESDLGVKLGAMQAQETHAGLAHAYRKLGKTVQTTGDYHAAQGTAEATTLGDPLQYHSSDAFIVKETLTNRQILIREFIQAQQATRSKLAAADRLKASTNVKREKVDEAISSLDEARSHESYLLQKTQRVTANLLQERRRWFARTAADLRLSIREYVLREIEAERRTLATLESARPDIRAIDHTGGLSRLGREAHPTVRRTSMAASQGPKGDAWSGVPRRSDGLDRSMVSSEILNGGEQGARAGAAGSTSAAGMKSMEEEDDDRVDAKNAASRLASSTF